MKIAVVTASINDNQLIDPVGYSDKVDYHAFVDEKKMGRGSPWITHQAFDFSSDPAYKDRRNAKIYKVLPFLFLPGYDYYFWIDSTHILKCDPTAIINTYLRDTNVAAFKHLHRSCVYEEGEAVKRSSLDRSDVVDNQLRFYRYMGYPENNGLYELPAFALRNCEQIQRLGLMWWENICMFSSRDQLSFPFVCHKLNITPAIIPGNAKGIGGNEFMPQMVY